MGLFNAVMALSGMIDTDVIEDERLARHTSYRIGGKADLFVTCHSYHALRRAVAVLDREQVPWVIIGKGSNVAFPAMRSSSSACSSLNRRPRPTSATAWNGT